MNEQVKSLANIWANRRSEDSQLGIVYTFTEPALKKFAELIVKECANFIHINCENYTDAEKLVKHFRKGQL